MSGRSILHPKYALPYRLPIPRPLGGVRSINSGSTRLLSTRHQKQSFAGHYVYASRKFQLCEHASPLIAMPKKKISTVSEPSSGPVEAAGRISDAMPLDSPLTPKPTSGLDSAMLESPVIGLTPPNSASQTNDPLTYVSGSPLSDAPSTPESPTPLASRAQQAFKSKKAAEIDPESDVDVPADEEEVKEAISRPPPVNSSYLPLPWKGRLGYACLNTYLRIANPPVFSSRTCRIASILENRHPLKDPSQPAHPTKNRPDREQPADHALGHAFVQSLGLANARDIVKMIRWNDRYGIKFMRLSSEMFPFASHAEYGYKLAPFASEALAEAGKVAGELGHRLTVHPGQFTQLGSPRSQVIESSIRDLEYHAEMLSLLKLPPQQDRDAVMILHMGGIFGDKKATLDRFRENYKALSVEVKNRLVLENDDVSWTVHDLLPICEELNIPLVLDYHHHNINFDADKIREGTLDIMQLYDRIKATWTRKGITQKMHYSEPTPAAITKSQRRKHNPRVQMLPPCDPTMDLMIEAKDKEQAVFDLMKTYKLPGHEKLNDIIPHTRIDENKVTKRPAAKKKKDQAPAREPTPVPEEEVGMGGPEGRVYWPVGMEHWLRPEKKVRVKRTDTEVTANGNQTPVKKKGGKAKSTESVEIEAENGTPRSKAKKTPTKRKRSARAASVSSTTSDEPVLTETLNEDSVRPNEAVRASRRTKGKKVNYAEE